MEQSFIDNYPILLNSDKTLYYVAYKVIGTKQLQRVSPLFINRKLAEDFREKIWEQQQSTTKEKVEVPKRMSHGKDFTELALAVLDLVESNQGVWVGTMSELHDALLHKGITTEVIGNNANSTGQRIRSITRVLSESNISVAHEQFWARPTVVKVYGIFQNAMEKEAMRKMNQYRSAVTSGKHTPPGRAEDDKSGKKRKAVAVVTAPAIPEQQVNDTLGMSDVVEAPTTEVPMANIQLGGMVTINISCYILKNLRSILLGEQEITINITEK